MKKMLVTTLTIAFAAAALVGTGCAPMESDSNLSGEMYRKVPKEQHEHYYPTGHKVDSFGHEQDCYYDINVDAYWCQYPKPKLPN